MRNSLPKLTMERALDGEEAVAMTELVGATSLQSLGFLRSKSQENQPYLQQQALFSSSVPFTLKRTVTTELTKKLFGPSGSPAAADGTMASIMPSRVIIDGDRGVGKTFLLVQMISLALQQGFVVVAVPRCSTMVDGTTTYRPHQLKSGQTVYVQDQYTKNILAATVAACSAPLKQTQVSREYTFASHSVTAPVRVRSGATLESLAQVGIRDETTSFEVLRTLLAELNAPGRPPFMLAIDQFNALCGYSDYFVEKISQKEGAKLGKPVYVRVHGFDMALGSLVEEYLQNNLTNGIVLGAISQTAGRERKKIKNTQRALGITRPLYNSDVSDSRSAAILGNGTVEPMSVDSYTRKEAEVLINYYATTGLMNSNFEMPLSSEFLCEKHILSGGNGRALYRTCTSFIAPL